MTGRRFSNNNKAALWLTPCSPGRAPWRSCHAQTLASCSLSGGLPLRAATRRPSAWRALHGRAGGRAALASRTASSAGVSPVHGRRAASHGVPNDIMCSVMQRQTSLLSTNSWVHSLGRHRRPRLVCRRLATEHAPTVHLAAGQPHDLHAVAGPACRLPHALRVVRSPMSACVVTMRKHWQSSEASAGGAESKVATV